MIANVLSMTIILPLAAAIGLAFIPANQTKVFRYGALIGSLLTFMVSLTMLRGYDASKFQFQFREDYNWFPMIGSAIRFGADGISLWLVLLTTFLSVIAIWFSFYVDKRVKAYMISLLVLESAMLGVFLSLDMLVFYVFFEATLVPMWMLIAIWGGERRIYAGLKFFLYTFAGSIFMLLGMIAMAWLNWQVTRTWSFSILDIQANVANGDLWRGAMHLQPMLFWAFALAFLVKCPAFPFHTWLPDAHVEAPTAGSVILAGVLLKMGTYGMLRFVLPFFPDVLPTMVPYVMTLAVIGILYGAVVAAVQPDVKKLVAYSSVAHMGFVLLGIFSLSYTGMVGGTLQQLNHGVSTGALFLLVGLIYERRHTRKFTDYGGLKAQMPIFALIFMIVMLSSVGLPGTNGFIGEFMALFGAFESGFHKMFGLNLSYPILAGAGVILAAVYLLWMYQKMFYGKNENPENQRLKDLKIWEIALCVPLLILIFWGGFFPNTFLAPMEKSIAATRMMAINEAGLRPAWNQEEQSVDEKGNLLVSGKVVFEGSLWFGRGNLIQTTNMPGAPSSPSAAGG